MLLRDGGRWLFGTTGSLTHRTARAGLWLAIGDGCARVGGIVKVIVLARLLSPAEFGIMGVALLVTTWVQYFSELGFSAALIHKRDDIRPYLDTVWTIQLIRSAAVAGVVILAAPLVGWAFNQTSTVLVLKVLALQIVLQGLVNPAVVYLRKELDTRREVVWRATGAVAGLAVGIPAAFAFRNVWALVLSLIAASAAETLASYWVKPYLPSLRVNWAKARELMSFGRWIFSFRAVGFFTANLDSLVVGKVLGATPLGIYQMALQLSAVPTSTLGFHLHGVMFPALAKLEDDSGRRVAFLRALALVSSIVVPAGLFFTVFGDLVVQLLLGPAWAEIAPLIGILPWVGVVNALSFVVSAFLLATGRPDLDFRSTLPKLAILTLALYPAAITHGLPGVAVVVVGATIARALYQVVLLLGVVSFSPRDLASSLHGGMIGSVPFAVSWLILAVFSPSVPLIAALSMGAYLVVLVNAVHGALSGRGDIGPASVGTAS
jgi:O-antigen/teichoic acid export membrane protein